ncbi:hypothetical protein EZJ19_08595 [Parasulfuritortus cantonensis]|uniref:Uncharacterized protein n=1 Tax=Parasulfuritortus cantonensis TaxID=2528202 RepID=A0A4R1BD15_9PROT|nr:hypothetical protein [Parasulfuritortus cantonensis]TCJ14933.1 hypothetical protein EZJ19_08595 [Parasulfuritortus cantonensis]
MGTWTLESVLHSTRLHDTAELFGNHYIVNFRLRYTPAVLGGFKEVPKLDWHEIIMMNEHHKGESWVFEANMYQHNPLSKTLEIWAKRYVEAYDNAAGQPDTTIKGSSKLMDKNGRPVPVAALERGLTDDGDKADAVRDYLKRHGGVMFIEIDDIPSINHPKNGEHKERLLIFNCGVVGGGPRTKAIQYLNVDAARPKINWTRRFDLSHTLTHLNTTGFRRVLPPPLVSMPRAPVFVSGECW